MRTIEFSSRRPSLNAVWMNVPRVEIRSQSEPKCPSTTCPRSARRGCTCPRRRRAYEVARAGCVAAELGALRVAPLRLLDLARDRGDQHVPLQPHTRVLERAYRLDVQASAPFMFEMPRP